MYNRVAPHFQITTITFKINTTNYIYRKYEYLFFGFTVLSCFASTEYQY